MHHRRAAALRVDVTFRGMPIDEVLVHYVRGRCRDLPAESIDVIIDHRGPGVVVDIEMNARRPTDALHACQEDPDPFLAVRNAFCVLAYRWEQRAVASVEAAE